MIDYRAYLRSDQWQRKREEALFRASGECATCLSTSSLQVHHRTYKRLGHELAKDLIVLCDGCHAILHHRMPKADTIIRPEGWRNDRTGPSPQLLKLVQRQENEKI